MINQENNIIAQKYYPTYMLFLTCILFSNLKQSGDKKKHFDVLFLTVTTNPMLGMPHSVGETEVVNNIE